MRKPEDTTLTPGTLLRLNCSTNLTPPVLWSFTSEGANSSMAITALGVVIQQFTPYFINSTSLYDLVAQTSNANEFYCGRYTCTDNNGLGPDSATATVASKCTSVYTPQ